MGLNTKSSFNIIIAGGGTGGHIYPAVAIAKALIAERPEAQIHFVGAKGGLEEKLIPREGFPLHLVPVGRLNRNVSRAERLITLFTLPWAFLKALRIVFKLRPRVILGVGGYASAPVVFVGALLRIKTLLWEPNAHPGMANRWLSHFVDESFVVFERARDILKTKKFTQAGMPVRGEIESAAAKTSAESDFSKRPFRILVFGGSQGARGINNVVSEAVERGGEWLGPLEIVHQTGPYDFERIQSLYQRLGLSQVKAYEFLYDMDQRYLWADLVICRSGTGTISEIATMGKPALFIPFPAAADNHQQKNAEVLVKAEAGLMILQKDFTVDRLIEKINELREHPEKLKQMASKAREFSQPQAAQQMAKLILQRAQL